MPRSREEVEILLIKLEQSLREAKLWSAVAPADDAFKSRAPFACDSMLFEQWLQFIFIPKMAEIVSSGDALPVFLALLPMAEQRFTNVKRASEVVQVIEEIDMHFAVS